MKKHMAITLAGIGLAAAPIFAFADLTITNNTNYDSTSSILGHCTSQPPLGSKGITRSHTSNTLNINEIRAACLTIHGDCEAQVYTNTTCGMPYVAIVHFNVDKGFISYQQTNSNFVVHTVNNDPFHIQIDQVA
jgi:hypothetical protein